jgi:hypothetical protein
LSGDLPAIRASDAERDEAAQHLAQAMSEGRLTLEELAQRLDGVYAAKTRTDLEPFTRDLPAESRRRPKRFTGAIFAGVHRKGRWRVARRSTVLSAMGDVDVDLRTAEINHPAVTITAFLLFGNVDFYVPTGVDVDVGGLTIVGHRREHGHEPPPTPGTPLIRIRIFGLFGTSDVWRIAPGTTGSYRELIRATRKQNS